MLQPAVSSMKTDTCPCQLLRRSQLGTAWLLRHLVSIRKRHQPPLYKLLSQGSLCSVQEDTQSQSFHSSLMVLFQYKLSLLGMYSRRLLPHLTKSQPCMELW